MTKMYCLTRFKTIQIAIFDRLAKLPETKTSHKFCSRGKKNEFSVRGNAFFAECDKKRVKRYDRALLAFQFAFLKSMNKR